MLLLLGRNAKGAKILCTSVTDKIADNGYISA